VNDMAYTYQLSNTPAVTPDVRGKRGRGYPSLAEAKRALDNQVDATHIIWEMDASGEQINAYDGDVQGADASYLGCVWGD